MSILDDSTLWSNAAEPPVSPPPAWNGSAWAFTGLTMQEDPPGFDPATLITYTGAAALPATLTFNVEPTVAAVDAVLYLAWSFDGVPQFADQVPLASEYVLTIPEGTTAFAWSVIAYLPGETPPDNFNSGTVLVTGDGLDPDAMNCQCVDERADRTLLELRVSLLRRLGFSAQVANPPPGMAALLDDFLRDAQLQLYERFTAMRTQRYFRWTMEPGVRFYGLRANEGICDLRLDPYKITWVGIEDAAGTWSPLYAGIHPGWYTSLARGMPCRYEVRQCIEVFPPPDQAYTLRVKGHFGLTPFTADADQPTLPSHPVFLLALANAKAHYGQADAANYFGQANSYVGGQVAGSHTTARYVPGAAPAVNWTRPKILGGDDE